MGYNDATGVLEVDRSATYTPIILDTDDVQFEETPIMFVYDDPEKGDPVSFFNSLDDNECHIWVGVSYTYDSGAAIYKNIRWSRMRYNIDEDGDSLAVEEMAHFPYYTEHVIPVDSGATKETDIAMQVLSLGAAGTLTKPHTVLEYSKEHTFTNASEETTLYGPTLNDGVYWFDELVVTDTVTDKLIAQIFNSNFFTGGTFIQETIERTRWQYSSEIVTHYEGTPIGNWTFQETAAFAYRYFAAKRIDIFSAQPAIRGAQAWDLSELISTETYGYYFDTQTDEGAGYPEYADDVDIPVALTDVDDDTEAPYNFDIDGALILISILTESTDYYVPQSEVSFVQEDFKPFPIVETGWTESAVGTVLDELLPGAGESLGVDPTCVRIEMWDTPRGRVDNPCFVIFDPVYEPRQVLNGDVSTYHRLDNRACPQPILKQDNGVLHAYKIFDQEDWVIRFNDVDRTSEIEAALSILGFTLPDIELFYML